ncbi:MAG: hypothetical protein JXA11_12810 [Phycisphaerae bacterium]|nr:hypothetical protein [Phycisphaerae bacterium]
MKTDLWKLHEDVVFGRSGGKVIWQPRIACWYDDKIFAGEPLPVPYTGMSLPDIYRHLGCSDRLYRWYNDCIQRIEHPAVTFRETKLNDTDTRIITETPVGNQVTVIRHSPNSPGVVFLKREVETEDELRVAAWREENTAWRWDAEHFENCRREVGDLGAPTIYLPRMNIQCLYIEKMGVEKAIYAL